MCYHPRTQKVEAGGFKISRSPGVVELTFNPLTQEEEAGTNKEISVSSTASSGQPRILQIQMKLKVSLGCVSAKEKEIKMSEAQ